ncbi:MAG: hypothetical protein ACLQIB_46905 [Isosphaeraceae bacterium]
MSTNDPEFYQAPKFTPEGQQPPRQRGCFFYGCIIATILMVMTMLLIGAVLYFAYQAFSQYVVEYTATAPRELPKIEMPAEDRESLKKRVEVFRKAVEEGKAVEPLVLTSDDLNALIEEEPDLKGKIHLRIEGSELKGQVSIPLERFAQVPGLGILKGRYLNGEAELKASFSDGVLIVTLDGIEVNGKRAPEEIMTKIRQKNLAEDAYNNPKNAAMLRKVESMEIKDGKVIIRVRARPGEAIKKPVVEELPSQVLAPDSKKSD